MSIDSIDVFCHFLPPKYCSAAAAAATLPLVMFERAQQISVMVDLSTRLRLLENFPGYRQVISLASPPIEVLAPAKSVELARIANDEMAATVAASQGVICGFAASLPMNHLSASLEEARRAVEQLGASGVQMFTSTAGRPLDEPEFEPLFALMADLDRPILLHPMRPMSCADYAGEAFSKFDLWWAIGWPQETTLAMARLAFAGIFDRYPDLKIVTHHVGGYMPMLAGRLGPAMDLLGTRNPPGTETHATPRLQGPVLDACTRFYADTASFGSRAAIECGLAFFGAEQLLFATDMPFDPGRGPDYIRSTLQAIREMQLTDQQRQQILVGNARRLFHLKN